MNKSSTYIILLLLLLACRNKTTAPATTNIPEKKEFSPVTISIQPFTGMPAAEVAAVAASIKKVYPYMTIQAPVPLPQTAFYPPRNRYRADSLISFLGRQSPEGIVTLGLTHRDISTTKGQVADWGVMGLGFCPGNACVASSFRVSKTYKMEQLFKVAIHEMGHTQGLPHCPEQSCFMRDAEGGNPTDEEKEFCPKCKAHLISKGWRL